MSSLIPFDPLAAVEPLSSAMDRLLRGSVVPMVRSGLAGLDLAMDVYETDDAVVVKVAAPGVKPEDVQISVVGDTLTIRGEVKSEEKIENERYYVREMARGQFARAVTLPGPVQADKAKAEFENGILTIELPKAEEAKAKVIKVKSK